MKTLLEQVINRDRTSGTKCFAFVNELKLNKVSTGDKLNKKTKFGELKVGDIVYVVGGFGKNVISEYTVEKITPISHFTRETYTSTYPDELKKINIDCYLYCKTQNGRIDLTVFVNNKDCWEIRPTSSGNLCVATTLDALKDALECPVIDIQPTNKSKYF